MGAATLLIHMLANVAIHIKVSKTTLGLDPAALRTLEAVMTSSLVLERTAAIVKPPSKSPMVGENMTEKMYLLASLAGILSSLPSVVRSTPSATVKKGTKKLVTNNGMAYGCGQRSQRRASSESVFSVIAGSPRSPKAGYRR